MKNAERLIEAVRTRPFLYDQSLQTFRHLATKNRNWIEVAKIVYGREDNTTVNRVKMQWKSLRDAFVKQQRKRQGSTGLVRPYIYENEMQFLLPHILMKERDDYGSGDDKGDDVPLSKFEVKTEDSVSLSASASGDSQADVEFEDETEGVRDVSRSLSEQSIETKSGSRDVYTDMHPVDAFFQGMAQTVKQLKPSTVARVKKAVANIVMDAEIDELDRRGEGSS